MSGEDVFVKEIVEDGGVLARFIPSQEAWKEGLNFFSPESEFIQVGTWGYNKEKQLLAHSHNRVPRQVNWTQEVLFIHQGRLQAHIYNSREELVAEWIASAGDILIMLSGGHGYTILDDETRVLEIKNGPYVGADKDRRRL